MNTKKINHGSTRMIAHRGLSGLERENTNMAFVAAGNRSYFGIETDVHCLADGNVILIHDDTTTRVAGVELTVEEQTFDTLRAIKLLDTDGVTPREDLRMPALEEYISTCRKYEKTCILELKNPMTEEQVKMIVERVDALGYLDEVVFISFCFDNLVLVKKLRPAQRVQFLFCNLTEERIENMKKYGMDIDIYYKTLTEEIVRDLHDKGFAINCWTVDDPEVAERLVSWGVDYITTNILE